MQGCVDQYNAMNLCISHEKNRIKQKELELREKVYNIEKKREIPVEEKEKKKNEEIII